MKITYTLSEKDYLDSQELILDQSKTFKRKVRTTRNLVLGILFILVAFLLKLFAQQHWNILTISGILLAVILFIFLFFLKNYLKQQAIKKKFKQAQSQPDLFTLERTLLLSPAKIKISIKGRNTKTIQWSIIQKVVLQTDFILYFLNDTQAGILASPGMKLTDEEHQNLLSIITEVLPKERIIQIK
ncbi:hypothetical protein ACWOFR_11960 [Carnobacterium gallinarum]|uniref:hypothetical protein n=1 Tax=Carnobacterium gallinarum TaxID=2749 RepID=UPI000551E652|nr:hypothetical protein [Carnobacterium gallinarum]